MSHHQSRFLIAFGMTFFLLSFFLALCTLPAHAASDPAISSKSWINFDLQIPLPVPQPGHEVNTANILAGYGIAYYIESLYKFLVGISGILAVLAIVYGGFMWMTSAGNTGKIGEAQKIIGNAITGLALALGSFLLLNTINPGLVTFKSLKEYLKPITPKAVGGGSSTLFTPPDPSPLPAPPPPAGVGTPEPTPAPAPDTPPGTDPTPRYDCWAVIVNYSGAPGNATVDKAKNKMTKTECASMTRSDIATDYPDPHQIRARAICSDGANPDVTSFNASGWKTLPTNCTAVP